MGAAEVLGGEKAAEGADYKEKRKEKAGRVRERGASRMG